MEVVQSFRTSDGRLFGDPAEAKAHEQTLIRASMRSAADEYLKGAPSDMGIRAVDAILYDWRKLYEILHAAATKLDVLETPNVPAAPNPASRPESSHADPRLARADRLAQRVSERRAESGEPIGDPALSDDAMGMGPAFTRVDRKTQTAPAAAPPAKEGQSASAVLSRARTALAFRRQQRAASDSVSGGEVVGDE